MPWPTYKSTTGQMLNGTAGAKVSGIPAASNAIAGATIPSGDTGTAFSGTNYPGLGTPMGGANPMSMREKATNYFNTNRNQIGMALGMGAQAVMGPFKDSPIAQIGQAGVMLNQQQAYAAAAKKMMAGERLENIPEASALTPEQQTILITQQSEKRKIDHAEKMDELAYDAKVRDMEQKGTISAQEAELARQTYQEQVRHNKAMEATVPTVSEQFAHEKEMKQFEFDAATKLEGIRTAGDIRKIQTQRDASIAEYQARFEKDPGLYNLYNTAFERLSTKDDIDAESVNAIAMQAVNAFYDAQGLPKPFKIGTQETGSLSWKDEAGTVVTKRYNPSTGKLEVVK